MVRLMAGWLSSRMIVGDVWGKPRSDANWRKKMTSLAHLSSARYAASQGLRATLDVSAEECTADGALVVQSVSVRRGGMHGMSRQRRR